MRVLYIEDSETDADLTQLMLARTAPEIELRVVTSLAEGLRCLKQAGEYDVVLTDLTLPGGSGLEVLALVRERRLPIAVVIITGSGDHDSAVAALRAGADDYLIKQDDYLERLPRTLSDALMRFRNNSPSRSHQILQVLCVEHNAFDVDLMRRHLALHAPHIHPTVVADAQEALNLLRNRDPEVVVFDAVLIDYHLPGMDGLELATILRNELKLGTPIVLVTGQGSEMVAARALHLGVDEYLSKHEGYLFEIPATLEKAQRQSELARERVILQQISLRLSRLLNASPTILYNLRFVEDTLQAIWVSENIERLLGYAPEETLVPGWWNTHVYADDRESVVANNRL